MTGRTRLADDFEAIRARRDELAREHNEVLQGNSPDDFDDDFASEAELLQAIFGDPQKAQAHAEALEHAWMISLARHCGIELVRHPDKSWSGTVGGEPIGPYPKLSSALSAAQSLREPYRR